MYLTPTKRKGGMSKNRRRGTRTQPFHGSAHVCHLKYNIERKRVPGSSPFFSAYVLMPVLVTRVLGNHDRNQSLSTWHAWRATHTFSPLPLNAFILYRLFQTSLFQRELVTNTKLTLGQSSAHGTHESAPYVFSHVYLNYSIIQKKQ